MAKDINTILEESVGEHIEISFVNHEDMILRYTKGKLLSVTKNLIVMKVNYKDRWWHKKKLRTYYLNRHAGNLNSIVVN